MTPRRTWSNVWEHFEKELVDVDGVLKAVCKYCQLKLVTKSGTSSLRGHVANACPSGVVYTFHLTYMVNWHVDPAAKDLTCGVKHACFLRCAPSC